MKLTITTLVALALVTAGVAIAAPKSATLTIRHELRGCHSWSFNGATWRPSQAISLSRGAVLTVVDNDVMPHTLIQANGRAAKAVISGAVMNRVGDKARVSFHKKGTYIFTTKTGDDYMKGVKTIGEDNVLKLVVTVT
jgi:hypothetical protein